MIRLLDPAEVPPAGSLFNQQFLDATRSPRVRSEKRRGFDWLAMIRDMGKRGRRTARIAWTSVGR